MSYLAVAQGLGGHSSEHEALVWWVAIGIFAMVILCLVSVYRRSRSRVEIEDADQILREHDADPYRATKRGERDGATSRR